MSFPLNAMNLLNFEKKNYAPKVESHCKNRTIMNRESHSHYIELHIVNHARVSKRNETHFFSTVIIVSANSKEVNFVFSLFYRINVCM